jgi:CMP-N,N'-diacetyllegionaminic acid synthase
MRVLWLIPARAGSRGIPDKNIRSLGGHPLIAWRIACARALAPARDIWVSTDSEAYADAARACGATVPFFRPPALATDEAGSHTVVLHAMEFAEANDMSFDAVALLQPTSPFVRPQTLRDALALLDRSPDADGVVATRRAKPSSFLVQEEAADLSELARRLERRAAVPRRQELKPEITPSGGLYLARWSAFRRHKTFYSSATLSHRTSDLEAVDIDDEMDWHWAEFLIDRGLVSFASIREDIVAARD